MQSPYQEPYLEELLVAIVLWVAYLGIGAMPILVSTRFRRQRVPEAGTLACSVINLLVLWEQLSLQPVDLVQ